MAESKTSSRVYPTPRVRARCPVHATQDHPPSRTCKPWTNTLNCHRSRLSSPGNHQCWYHRPCAHGKSTVVKAISGVHLRFKNELSQHHHQAGTPTQTVQTRLRRGRSGTIPLPVHTPDEFTDERGRKPAHVSFVDAGARHFIHHVQRAGMDELRLLVAGNESRPQPQTSEHLAAAEIMRPPTSSSFRTRLTSSRRMLLSFSRRRSASSWQVLLPGTHQSFPSLQCSNTMSTSSASTCAN